MRPLRYLIVIRLRGGVHSSVMAVTAGGGTFCRVPDCGICADAHGSRLVFTSRSNGSNTACPPAHYGQRPKPLPGREGPHQLLRLSQLRGHPGPLLCAASRLDKRLRWLYISLTTPIDSTVGSRPPAKAVSVFVWG